MKILFVCRYNQARSILAGALLRKLYPNVEVFTAGIEAQDGQPVPLITPQLCLNWSLPGIDRLSISIDKLLTRHPATSFDHVVVADQLVKERIERSFAPGKVTSITDLADFPSISPVDPTGFDRSSFAAELAKVAILTIRWAEKFGLGEQRGNLNFFLFDEITNSLGYQKLTAELDSLQLVDTDISRPDPSFWRSLGAKVILFDPRDLNTSADLVNGMQGFEVLVSRFEVDNPSQIYLSQPWREFLYRITKDRSVMPAVVFPYGSEALPAERILSLAFSAQSSIIAQ